ncbi:MAG: metallophosphoesterase [Candidatus Puniceispirillaceae bacterium]
MRKSTAVVLALVIAITYLTFSISQNLRTERNDVSLTVSDPQVEPTLLSIAVIGDTHTPEGREPLAALRELLLEVKAADPDLVLLVGDYIADPEGHQLSTHRENIIKAMKLVEPVPRAVVLGNYETWSNANEWLSEFARLGVRAVENEVVFVETVKGPICIRGLGDKFTNRFKYVGYPATCDGLPKITITHDPAGAFDHRVRGLVVAGHTHCGQISLPFVGPLWVPTDAPDNARCGLYQDEYRTLFVTSGVGTAILPLRYGAQSHWDLLSLEYVR